MIRKQFTDNKLIAHLSTLPEDGRDVYMICDGKVRLTALQATTMLNKMKANHETGLMETYVLGQGYLAGALLASAVKGNDRIQLAVECGGPIGGLYIESWACGAVRGYLKNNPLEIKGEVKDFNTSMLYGPGFLSITKLLEGNRTPFTGQVMLQYGNLANDLAVYYRESEQTPTLFSLSIQFSKTGMLTGAGGLFMQAMPDCDEDTLSKLQDMAQDLPSIGKYLAAGNDINDYVKDNFTDAKHLAHQFVGFSCPCSEENFRYYLSSLPEKEKKSIMDDDIFPLELTCFNCNSHYRFSKEEIKELFEQGYTKK